MNDEVVNDLDTNKFELLLKALPSANVNTDAAHQYAVEFLQSAARINKIVYDLKNQKIFDEKSRDIEYTHACNKIEVKTQSEKERQAVLNVEYQTAQTKYQQCKNSIEYWENLYQLFVAAHQYYKAILKEF